MPVRQLNTRYFVISTISLLLALIRGISAFANYTEEFALHGSSIYLQVATSAVSRADISAYLSQHFIARKRVSPKAIPDLKLLGWDAYLAIEAANWAQQCTFGSSISSVKNYGQNVYAATGFEPTPEDAVRDIICSQS
jgi:hypothetical protein